MKRVRSFFKPLAGMNDYADQQIRRCPLIEICGHSRVLIENHQGIDTYDHNLVFIKVHYGCIQITGEDLMLSWMSKDKIVVNGKIIHITLPTGG